MSGSGLFDFRPGRRPLLVSIPHDGQAIPPEIAQRMSPQGRAATDADWHVGRLYDFVEDLEGGRIAANYARYVVDLNRPADGQSLYPGQDETGLCPTTTFAHQPLYRPGCEPGPAEIRERIERYWKPYHQQLAAELGRLSQTYGAAMLWEAHSIRSQVPRFFEGKLPDFNFGTDSGRTCPDAVVDDCREIAEAAGFSTAVNGRFKGGYITRQYADPQRSIYSIQLELSQVTYMDEEAMRFDAARAERVRPLIRQMLARCLELVES